jgi:hypothetical protein
VNAAEQLADEEVERAMNETPDEEEAAEEETPAPPPEPDEPDEPPASQMTEQEAERKSKQLDKLATTYVSKAFPIANELGLPVVACPLCTYPGMAQPRTAEQVTSDVETAVLALIGQGTEMEYEDYEGFQQCTVCKGKGEVKTGAVIERSRRTTCPNPNCGGKGYVTVPVAAPPLATVAPFPGAQVPFQPLPQGVNDQWGRPAGHPQWGIDPSLIGV